MPLPTQLVSALVALLLLGFGVTARASEADRDVAIWALHMGGFVVQEGDSRRIRDVADVPDRDFRIEILNLVGANIHPPHMEAFGNLTDAPVASARPDVEPARRIEDRLQRFRPLPLEPDHAEAPDHQLQLSSLHPFRRQRARTDESPGAYAGGAGGAPRAYERHGPPLLHESPIPGPNLELRRG